MVEGLVLWARVNNERDDAVATKSVFPWLAVRATLVVCMIFVTWRDCLTDDKGAVCHCHERTPMCVVSHACPERP